jgi:uncharacterized membrane protein YccC
LFWIVTAWPSGADAITWAAVTSLLFAACADQAYVSAKSFVTGVFIAVVAAAVMNFAVLPNLETFVAFSLAIGLWLVPAGAVAGRWPSVEFTSYMAVYLVPLLAPENQMSYDTVQFYNAALAIFSGTVTAALFFCLIPPLSPAFRTRRLLALTLRDLRRLAIDRTFKDWAGHIHGRLSAMPGEATPLQRAQLLAALSVGTEIIRLYNTARLLSFGAQLEAALSAFAAGKNATATARLACLDEALAGDTGATPEALRARGSILIISEALTHHAEYFAAGAPR